MLLGTKIGVSQTKGSDPLLIANFETPQTSLQWKTVNDGVMGGISKGDSYITEASQLLFKGDISLENNGGFSSIRTYGQSYNLKEYKGIEIRFKGDGRKYYFTSRVSNRNMLAFWSPLDTEEDKWQTVRIPFSSFYATSFGRKIQGRKLDISDITSFGIMLYDKNDGRFSLLIDSIQAYK